MPRVLIISRDITVEECPWLDHDIKAGTPVWSYDGHTYDCVEWCDCHSRVGSGVTVTAKAAETPFFEVPRDAVRAKR